MQACEDDSEVPTVTPSEKQVVAVQATAEGSEGNPLVFAISGGKAKTACDDSTACPPWVKVDNGEGGGLRLCVGRHRRLGGGRRDQ